MKRFTMCWSVFFMVMFFFSPVFAQEKTSFSVTPRVWLASFSYPYEDGSSYEDFFLPMYGATVTVSPAAAPNFSFLLTVLTGSGDGDGVFIDNGVEDANLDVDRTDAELLARYVIPETSFSLFGGLRYITFEADSKGTEPMEGRNDVFRSETDTDLWIAELGMGITANITESGRHRFFSNVTFGLAFSDSDWSDNKGNKSSGDDSNPSLDFNAGYQANINERIAFDARYRVFALRNNTDIADGVAQDKMIVIHGPEIGVTVRF